MAKGINPTIEPKGWECKNCGAFNDPDEDYCSDCGADTDGVEPESEEDTELEGPPFTRDDLSPDEIKEKESLLGPEKERG